MKNKIILFMLFSTIILFANVKLEIFKAASPQYIEGDRTIHYTLIVTDASVSETYPMPIVIKDNIQDGNFSNADINITGQGDFNCTIDTSNQDSEIVCTGDINTSGSIVYITYDVIAPNYPGQITNVVSVYEDDGSIDDDDPIDDASITVTIFPNYANDLNYSRDLCYIPPPISENETCRQSGAFLYGPDCNSSIIVKRNTDVNIRSLGNVHIFKAYTSEISSDDCYTEVGSGKIACGNEKDIEDLLNKDSSLYLELAFNEAHDFSLGDFNSTTDENRTIVDINTEPSSNQVTFFEYIALIGQYNVSDSNDTIEEYIYPCDSNYSVPGIIIQQTGAGLNNAQMIAGDTLEDQAGYIDYDTFSKVGTKIVNQPFVLGVTYLNADGNPATYDGEYAAGKTINAPIVLTYKDSPIWSGELVHGEQHTLTLENFSNDGNSQESYPVFTEAFRSGQIEMKLIDYGAFFTSVDGLSCGASSLNSSLCLLPGCLNSAEQIVSVFPIEHYPHVAQCVYGDGGGAAPCDSDAYNGACGGIKATVSPEKYNHDLGCMHCLADAITPDIYSNSFSTRPKDFSLEVPDLGYNGVYRAGQPYPIDLNATTEDASITRSPDYNTTLEGDEYPSKVIAVIGLEENLSLSCPYDANESQTIVFSDGYSASPISYSNVGKVKLVIMDQNWTSIDQDPSIYNIPRCIDGNVTDPIGDPYGRVGCKIITEKTMTFVPHHFNIDANLTDHNSDHNFTYLHDINKYDSLDDNHSMGAELNISIQAMNKDDINITTNYIEGCYAKDTNLTLVLGDINITYPGSIPALTQFLYYNPLEDDGINDGEGEHNFTTPITSPISIASLPIENIDTSFPDDAPDGNGTTHIQYKLNFDRKQNLVVNPFKMVLNDINITDDDNVTEIDGTETITHKNATLYYAKASSSKFFYEDITEDTARTPITVNIYCDLGIVTGCPIMGIDTYKAQIDETYWWLSLGHTENTTQHDGNITLQIGNIIEGAGSPSISSSISTDPAEVQITPSGLVPPGGVDRDVNVTSNPTSTGLPMTVLIELVHNMDPTLPYYTFSQPYTNRWLIYDENSTDRPPTPFYKVRFIGEAKWTGEGQTGHVVDVNASYKKSQRVDW